MEPMSAAQLQALVDQAVHQAVHQAVQKAIAPLQRRIAEQDRIIAEQARTIADQARAIEKLSRQLNYMHAMFVTRDILENRSSNLSAAQYTRLKRKVDDFSTAIHSRNNQRRQRVKNQLVATLNARRGNRNKTDHFGSQLGDVTVAAMLRAAKTSSSGHVAQSRHGKAAREQSVTSKRR
ncbi:hypothetical protein D9Q98_003180 [Chlorella vulgaris]|uniref:Uncharacterized protein n=1 Tax=Chlorella vulgaris TaxID=3077 RepID=A0A9D4TS35_CHLVU|nr:hypothetical protein D9Q98_003180 [Chlorella vulgaris]